MPPLPKGGKVLRSKTRGDIVFKSDWYIAFYIPQSNCLKSAILQPPLGKGAFGENLFVATINNHCGYPF